MSIQVKIWANAAGLVTKAQLVGSTGNPELDTVLRNEVLSGIRLPEPPPAGMPMPINLRISARKPN
jgi:outer membrane biosynthesis protein TonB